MIIEGVVFDKRVFINTDKIDYFYDDGLQSKVIIGETVFRVDLSIGTIRAMLKG